MKPKTFAILAAITVAVAGAALYAVSSRSTGESASSTPGGAPLVPGLAGQLNQVVALTLTGPGGTATLTRPNPDSDLWVVKEKAGYPADRTRVRQLILALAEARTVEPRTASPERYAQLAVDEAGAVHVTLGKADGRTLPTLLMGKTASAGRDDHPARLYARRAGEDRSWLAECREPAPATDPLPWLDRSLPFLPESQVLAVTVDRPGAAPLSVSRADASQKDFTVTGLPAGARPDQPLVDRLASALEFLSYDDVAPAPPPAAAGKEDQPAADSVTTTVRAANGLLLHLRIDRQDGKPWVRFSAETGPALAADGKTDGKEDGKEMARTIQDRYGPWRYRLSDYAAKDLTPTAEELVAKPAKPDDKP